MQSPWSISPRFKLTLLEPIQSCTKNNPSKVSLSLEKWTIPSIMRHSNTNWLHSPSIEYWMDILGARRSFWNYKCPPQFIYFILLHFCILSLYTHFEILNLHHNLFFIYFILLHLCTHSFWNYQCQLQCISLLFLSLHVCIVSNYKCPQQFNF